MGNDSPPNFCPNLQIKMPKHKFRTEMGLLNTLQEVNLLNGPIILMLLLRLLLPAASPFDDIDRSLASVKVPESDEFGCISSLPLLCQPNSGDLSYHLGIMIHL